MSREWTKNPQKLEILLQNFADIIWEYDTQAKDLYPETECAQRFGLPPVIHNGAQGLVQSGILHPDYLPSLSHVFRSLESQECTLSAELLSGLAPVGITGGTGRFLPLIGRCREYAGRVFSGY
ncbi:MAG: hypothetical protein ACLVLH_03875 [Eisenbergiella massiliensis]